MAKRTTSPSDIGAIVFGAPKADHDIVATLRNGERKVVKTLPSEGQARTWAWSHRHQYPTTEVVPCASIDTSVE